MSCILVQLIDNNEQPCKLTMVKTAQGSKYLVVNQVQDTLLRGVVTRKVLHSRLRQVRAKPPLKSVTPVTRAKLVSLGAVPPSGGSPLLASVPLCLKAVKSLGCHACVPAGLADLQNNVVQLLHGDTAVLLQQNAEGSANPQALVFTPELPLAMEPDTAPTLRPRQRLSLQQVKPALARRQELSLQLEALESFSKMTIVVGRSGGAVGSLTWQDIHKQCMLYLGYIHLCFGVVFPNLEHFTRADFLMAYCCSKGKRGDKGGSICKALYVAKRVVQFWVYKGPPSDAAKLTELNAWLEALCPQVKKAWPSKKRNVGELRAAGKWADARAILVVLVQKKAEAEAAFSSQASLSHEQARLLHDVALACTMFGWLPPPRAACVRTLCTPGHRGPCPHPDCRDQACWGNRLYCIPPHTLKMSLPHHKSEKVWGAIEYELLQDLAGLLHLYWSKAYKVLKRQLQVEHPFLFMSEGGAAFDSASFCVYWQKLLQAWDLPAVSPHTLRHIFVDQRMQSSSTPGPCQQGAAICMGHDVAQWMQSYDLQSMQRTAQAAVNAMPQWRAAVLGEHVASAHDIGNVDAAVMCDMPHDVPSGDSDGTDSRSASREPSWESDPTTSPPSSESLGSTSVNQDSDNLAVELSEDEAD